MKKEWLIRGILSRWVARTIKKKLNKGENRAGGKILSVKWEECKKVVVFEPVGGESEREKPGCEAKRKNEGENRA